MKKKRWLIAVISLIAVSLLAIGGTIFYGTAILPGQRIDADRKACQVLDAGLLSAYSKATVLAEKTPPASDDEVAKAYISEADKAIGDAYGYAAKNSEVANALAKLSFARLSGSSEKGLAAITSLVNSLDPVKAVCEPFKPTESPTAGN